MGQASRGKRDGDRRQRIVCDYGQAFLFRNGPLISGAWTVPRALANALAAAGKPVPPPVHGVMLVDTGATGTCISQKAAAALGLMPLRMQPGYGAGGRHDNPVYFAAFELEVPDSGQIRMGWEQEVQGIPHLDRHAKGTSIQGRPVEVIGLLGRDILRHARLSYDGMSGALELEFDIASLKKDPSR